MWFTTLFLLSLLSRIYCTIGPDANMYIMNKRISPDGFTRSGVLAGDSMTNAVFPGPLVTGFKGDEFNLNVVNLLTDSTMTKATSIHWHGFFQAGSSWADGAAGITQCPILPGHAFLYQFKVPDQAGTFWYHSHFSTQYCDGLRGALVVYDRFDPHRFRYDVDNEKTVITLADWYHTPAPSAGLAPTPDSTLINGIGRYAGGPATDLTVIRVVKGLRYRFRLVSISCDPNYTFSIDGHNMTVIEVDGVNVHPTTVDSIQIFAGQRYSFVLDTNQPVANYWVRANPNIGTTGFNGGVNSAILRYLLAPDAEPRTTQTHSLHPLLETALHPISNPAAPGLPIPGGADLAINVAMGFNFTTLKYTLNGATFVSPTVPVLLQILSGAQAAQDLLPSGSLYVLPRNKVIELTIPGVPLGGPHPFHLHGHTFSVIKSAGSDIYNYDNPVRRDVVSVGLRGDNVTIRFDTNNPGPWILHCHINWHLEIGLALVFAEDTGAISREDPPSAWDDLCPIYNAYKERPQQAQIRLHS